MNTEQIIKLAREAGIRTDLVSMGAASLVYSDGCDGVTLTDLQKFTALVTQAERESRQAAQIENEQLKARLARSGVELRSAVFKEREACAKLCDSLGGGIDPRDPDEVRLAANSLAADIRARSAHDCTNCDCADNEPCKKTDWSAA